MPKIIIDGKEVEFTTQTNVLQVAIDNKIEIPYYCYHPGLSVPASCRMCLVDIEGGHKLVPSCFTPPKDGMIVHCNHSTKAVANQKTVLEYLLVSHPLDCPVCDKAGECLLQDYSYGYGRSESRLEDDKVKNPKKDIGQEILLYADRCIMCTRCVRFTREISGTSELMVDGRGYREEIDIAPGRPLNNKLSLNVVDLCPVGALLDKSFLFQQRVWLLKRTASISPVDAGGENIWIDQNENSIYRIKPRYNADINQWWISNDTRNAFKAINPPNRLLYPLTRELGAQSEASYSDAVRAADAGLRKLHAQHGNGSLYAMLSPMMACEEAWLLGRYIRSIDPKALLISGPVPTMSDDIFHHYITKKETFRIQGEKVPNRRGIERVIQMLGGDSMKWTDFTSASCQCKVKGGWIVGGYLSNWIRTAPECTCDCAQFTVVQDVLPNIFTEKADVLLPGTFWAEKDGTWENWQSKLQAFAKAIEPPPTVRREGDVYLKLLEESGTYNAFSIREEMGEPFVSVKDAPEPETVNEPAAEFVEL